MGVSKFTAEIKIIIGNPYVDTPPHILQHIFDTAGRDKGPIPIRDTINGAGYVQTLVRYAGAWRLYINGIMLKAAGIKYPASRIYEVVGRQVVMTVVYDPRPRTIPLHPFLRAAFKTKKAAKAAYDALAPYRKHEINRYLGFLKSDDALARNIQRILQHLRSEESDGLYPLMRRKKSAKNQ